MDAAPDFRDLLREQLPEHPWCGGCGLHAAATALQPMLYRGRLLWTHPACARPFLLWELAVPEVAMDWAVVVRDDDGSAAAYPSSNPLVR
jgi:hypothetical protein